jgi:hypothetical protein
LIEPYEPGIDEVKNMSRDEQFFAEGPTPKKKHLLHRLVKKVLIHSRKTIEIWYGLPNTRRFEDCNIWLPVVDAYRTVVTFSIPVRNTGYCILSIKEFYGM